MSFSGRMSSADSQFLTFPRRELLQKFGGALILVAAPKSSLKSSTPEPSPKLSTPEPSPKLSTPKAYPLPEFNIGDLVASDWEPDEEDDDAPDSATDFGEVLGMRWLPEAESCFAAKTWVYYVWWTHSTCDGTCYPCYDGEPTRGCDLRLVSAQSV